MTNLTVRTAAVSMVAVAASLFAVGTAHAVQAAPVKDTIVSRTTEPDQTGGDTTTPRTTEPDVTDVATTAPEVTVPEVTVPEVTVPEVVAPLATPVPEVVAPVVQAPTKKALPATGGSLGGLGIVVLLLGGGITLVHVARRTPAN
jgi:hypothetical protein